MNPQNLTRRTCTAGERIPPFLSCNRWRLETGAKTTASSRNWTESPGSSHWAKPSSTGSRVTRRAVKRATVTTANSAAAEAIGAPASIVRVHGGVGEARRRCSVTEGVGILVGAIAVSSVPIQLCRSDESKAQNLWSPVLGSGCEKMKRNSKISALGTLGRRRENGVRLGTGKEPRRRGIPRCRVEEGSRNSYINNLWADRIVTRKLNKPIQLNGSFEQPMVL